MSKPAPSMVVSSSDSTGELNTTTYSAKGEISNENIITTRDRAALVFHEYVRNRAWTTDWLAYLGVFVGLSIPLVTATQFRGVVIGGNTLASGEICKAVVLMLCIWFGLLGLYCLIRRIRNRKKLTCEYFLNQLKKDNVNVD